MVWLGIENNVSNTLGLICVRLGVKFVIVAPEIDKTSIDEDLNKIVNDSGLCERTLDLEKALTDADFVHTDTWMNMEFFENGKVKPSFEQEYNRRLEVFKP